MRICSIGNGNNKSCQHQASVVLVRFEIIAIKPKNCGLWLGVLNFFFLSGDSVCIH